MDEPPTLTRRAVRHRLMVSLQSSVQLALVVGRASRLCLALHSAVVAALIFVTLVGLHSVKDVMALQAEWADDSVMANSDRHGVGVVCGARASPSATFCHSVPFSRSSEWVEAGAGGATLRVWWRGPAHMLYVTMRSAAVCVCDGADPPLAGKRRTAASSTRRSSTSTTGSAWSRPRPASLLCSARASSRSRSR